MEAPAIFPFTVNLQTGLRSCETQDAGRRTQDERNVIKLSVTRSNFEIVKRWHFTVKDQGIH